MRTVLHVVYVVFTVGGAASSGDELRRRDLIAAGVALFERTLAASSGPGPYQVQADGALLVERMRRSGV